MPFPGSILPWWNLLGDAWGPHRYKDIWRESPIHRVIVPSQSNISRKLTLNPEDGSQTIPPLHSPLTWTTDIQLVMSVEPNTDRLYCDSPPPTPRRRSWLWERSRHVTSQLQWLCAQIESYEVLWRPEKGVIQSVDVGWEWREESRNRWHFSWALEYE